MIIMGKKLYFNAPLQEFAYKRASTLEVLREELSKFFSMYDCYEGCENQIYISEDITEDDMNDENRHLIDLVITFARIDKESYLTIFSHCLLPFNMTNFFNFQWYGSRRFRQALIDGKEMEREDYIDLFLLLKLAGFSINFDFEIPTELFGRPLRGLKESFPADVHILK